MSGILGIRAEDKNRWEKRVPLTPDHVRSIAKAGIDVVVQSSSQRAFEDAAFERAGARVAPALPPCRVVFGVKEMPPARIQPDTAYVLFAHVIKGQRQNMPMLRRFLEARCTLIDYEKILDARNRRVVHFGGFAGVVGMIDSLWILGRRFAAEGIETPFADMRQARDYRDLAEAEAALDRLGRAIAAGGIPEAVHPVVIGVAGAGNVGKGVHDVLGRLPTRGHAHERVADISSAERDRLHVVRLNGQALVQRRDGGGYDRDEYRANPDRYEACVDRVLPHLTVLMVAIYWEKKYPRVVTKADLARLEALGRSRLRVIGDLSADIEGAVEATVKVTDPDNPTFVFDPATGGVTDGVAGKGPAILAVDFLPTELPVDASRSFGDALAPFVPAIARANYAVPFAELDLPPEIKRAVICHQGALTPKYAYIDAFL